MKSQPQPLDERRLSVCIATQSFRPTIGGAELQVERILPRLAARGVEATVFTRAYAGEPRHERIDGGEVRRTRVAGRSPAAAADYVGETLAFLARNRRRLDLVHSYSALSDATIALGGTYLGLPALVRILRTGHLGDWERLETKPGGKLRARLLGERAWFVAQSVEARDELEGRGVAPDRIFDIPNGVDVDVYRPADPEEKARLRRELGLPDGRRIGVFTGRLSAEKRVDALLRALPDVPDLFVVVAGDGPERPRLETLANELGVAERVRFVGFTNEVDSLLRASDAFFLPSATEGMSNALMEAMACGLACVAGPVSGVPQLFGETRGLVADAGRSEEWRIAVARVANDAQLRAQLGHAAAEHVAANLTLDATAARVVAAYRAIVGRQLSQRSRQSSH